MLMYVRFIQIKVKIFKCLIYFSILSQCLSFVITELGLLGLAEQNTGTEDGEVRSKGMKGCSGVVISI